MYTVAILCSVHSEVLVKKIYIQGSLYLSLRQESRREGWTEKRLAVGFCLGSGLFGSYNSD